jgi:hypothetical protein
VPFFVSFRNSRFRNRVENDWLTNRWSKLLKSRDAQFADHIFPLSVIGAGSWDLPNWVQGYEKFWIERAAKAETDGNESEAKAASYEPDKRIARIRLSDKISRLHPRHVVPPTDLET